MFELDATKKSYPFLTMLIGLVAYLASGTIVGLILTILKVESSLHLNYGNSGPSYDFFMFIIGAALGGILLGLMMKMFKLNRLIAIVVFSIIGEFSGIIIGEIAGFIAYIYFSGYSFPISFVFGFMIANAIYGASITAVFHGGKSIGLFALVCGITSVPFGILMLNTSGIVLIGINLSTLVFLTSLGETTGLSIGLYSLVKSKNKKDSA
jgi:MFS family permease